MHTLLPATFTTLAKTEWNWRVSMVSFSSNFRLCMSLSIPMFGYQITLSHWQPKIKTYNLKLQFCICGGNAIAYFPIFAKLLQNTMLTYIWEPDSLQCCQNIVRSQWMKNKDNNAKTTFSHSNNDKTKSYNVTFQLNNIVVIVNIIIYIANNVVYHIVYKDNNIVYNIVGIVNNIVGTILLAL